MSNDRALGNPVSTNAKSRLSSFRIRSIMSCAHWRMSRFRSSLLLSISRSARRSVAVVAKTEEEEGACMFPLVFRQFGKGETEIKSLSLFLSLLLLLLPLPLASSLTVEIHAEPEGAEKGERGKKEGNKEGRKENQVRTNTCLVVVSSPQKAKGEMQNERRKKAE